MMDVLVSSDNHHHLFPTSLAVNYPPLHLAGYHLISVFYVLAWLWCCCRSFYSNDEPDDDDGGQAIARQGLSYRNIYNVIGT
jgi:hypothetical protein